MERKKSITHCLQCGAELVNKSNSEQVDGRIVTAMTICPSCFWQCPNCGDWYRQINSFELRPVCQKCTT